VQILRHSSGPPAIESQTDSSGQPFVEPAVAQLLVQYPPSMEVSQERPGSQPPFCPGEHADPTLGGVLLQARETMPVSTNATAARRGANGERVIMGMVPARSAAADKFLLCDVCLAVTVSAWKMRGSTCAPSAR
jgi:hypothetical protein